MPCTVRLTVGSTDSPSTFSSSCRRGFNLVELLVVLVVTVVLMSLMMPALSRVKERAHRLICSSNLRSIGMGIDMYTTDDSRDHLPSTIYGGADEGTTNLQEMMILHRGPNAEVHGFTDPRGFAVDAEVDDESKVRSNWDGLGWLVQGGYCSAPKGMYCPSHKGDHLWEKYRDEFMHLGQTPVYGNYHYAGDFSVQTRTYHRIEQGHALVLATDGLRTRRDFNHVTGMNVLRADISVTWQEDHLREIYERLPEGLIDEREETDETYGWIWDQIGEDPQ